MNLMDEALELIKEQAQYVESLSQIFSQKDQEMKSGLDSTMDELIASLKEINLAYENLLGSNERLYQGVKRIVIGQDSKEVLESVQKLLMGLEKLNDTIGLIKESKDQVMNKKDREEVQKYFNKVISNEELA